MNTARPIQIPLPLTLDDAATFANFYPGSNANILKSLQDFLYKQNEQFFYLCGQLGTGRSHLLQASCHYFNNLGKLTHYLSLKEWPELYPEILLDIKPVNLVAFDDIHFVIGNPLWEEALFHCYNHLRDQNIQFIVAANVLPRQLPCQLADLQSRFSWGLASQLQPLDDVGLATALQMRASNRGVPLPQEVITYLLHHYTRSMRHLIDALEILETASLIEQHRLTIPFVKRILIK